MWEPMPRVSLVAHSGNLRKEAARGDGDGDRACGCPSSVIQQGDESTVLALEAKDQLIANRDVLSALEPAGVPSEDGDGHRIDVRGGKSAVLGKCIERVDSRRIEAPVGSRAEEHLFWHVIRPQGHRMPNDDRIDASLDGMSGHCHSIRSGPDDEPLCTCRDLLTEQDEPSPPTSNRRWRRPKRLWLLCVNAGEGRQTQGGRQALRLTGSFLRPQPTPPERTSGRPFAAPSPTSTPQLASVPVSQRYA